ncbi:MAG: transporter substrate-binding domain-containing protein [Rhodospirillales bacterium]|nr:transporter substrate-binding domain-containing protein [Rhodospirillales bacterium]
MRKLIAALALAFAAGVASPSAQAQTVDDIVKKGEIVVGVDLTNAPWGFLDAQQQPAGFDPAYAQMLADKLGVKLKIERVTSPGRIPFLQSGRVDVILSTLSITAERAKQVWFSTPYAPNPLILIGEKSKNVSKYSDLKGLRVAVPRGSPQDIVVSREAPDAIIMKFDDDASVQQALLTGQADLIGGGILVPATLNKMAPGKEYEPKITLSELFMGMAVKKGNIDLLQYLNTFVFLTKQSGEIDQLTRKHLSVPVGNLPVM